MSACFTFVCISGSRYGSGSATLQKAKSKYGSMRIRTHNTGPRRIGLSLWIQIHADVKSWIRIRILSGSETQTNYYNSWLVGLDGWLVDWLVGWLGCCLPECSLMVLLYESGDPLLSLKHRSIHAEHETRTQTEQYVATYQYGWDLAKWLERLTANVVVATVLSSIPASSDTVESEGRQMKQCWIEYIKKVKKTKNPPLKTYQYAQLTKIIGLPNLLHTWPYPSNHELGI